MGSNMAMWRVRWWRSLMGLLVAAGLAACSMPPPSEGNHSGSQTAVMAETSSAPIAAPQAAKAQSTLGTQWGEGRESVTKAVQASRLTPDRPLDMGQMRYSDEDSIRRALGRDAEQQTNALLADGDVELQLLGGNGAALRIFSSRGAKDFHVAGRNGERYELVYTNRSKRYYEVVATVDGLDVLSGQPGSIQSAGYLLRPGERLVIDGFRKSDREVAAFRFSAKGRAYANNTPAGDARNVGVIGTALFEVRLDERDPDLPRRRAPEVELRDPRDPSAFPADGRQYAPPPQYRR
ncbi:hypothetical protein [Comamonas sp. 26]|uniref:hypothetical protein n=1 Tax=Comamonas sp. 26 TaxID=2035201 RepID=UPI000C18CA55|nr:hypothetical protein [Comamonas sp. 26]PIG00498.1 hypothetical protein CLU84_3478 [Comamonas sp. 26]